MGEVGGPVARRHRCVIKAKIGEERRLQVHERLRLGEGLHREAVQRLIKARRGEVFRGAEALVEALGREHLLQFRRGKGLAGLMMHGIVLQNAWPGGAHLMHLGGELHKIPRHAGAGEAGIGHVREEPM